MGWNNCENAKTCGHTICFEKACQKYDPKDGTQQTNGDRIREMSDEELAEELADCAIGLYRDTREKGLPELPESVKREVYDSLLKWLKQPAEG